MNQHRKVVVHRYLQGRLTRDSELVLASQPRMQAQACRLGRSRHPASNRVKIRCTVIAVSGLLRTEVDDDGLA